MCKRWQFLAELKLKLIISYHCVLYKGKYFPKLKWMYCNVTDT